MRNARIYLDQNIIGYLHDEVLDIGYLRDEVLDFSKAKEVDWIYSSEHFDEISRGDDLGLFSVLETLKARQIELEFDENLKMKDTAQIYEYSCPYERFERYRSNMEEVDFDAKLFDPLTARLAGADNYDAVSKMPERIKSEISRILISVGIANDTIDQSVENGVKELEDVVIANLAETKSLESLRKDMGTEKGKAGQVPGYNPIKEIWELIKENCEGMKGISCDRFFGFDPVDKQGDETEPLYLGIVGCYTVLNMVGYRTDKGISHQDNVQNIASDARHVGHAVFCDGLMSADQRLIAKAKAIYVYKGLKCQLFDVRIKKND